MISNLVTFGASWPAGAELKNRTQAFGYLLAKMLNAPVYKNCAIDATSNDRMILQLQEYILNNASVTDHVAIFFITSPSRHLHLDYKGNIKELKVPPLGFESTSDPVVDNWYRYFQSDAFDYFNLYKTLLSLQRICEQYQIRDYYLSGSTNIHPRNIDRPGVDMKKIFPTTCAKMFGLKNQVEFNDTEQNQYIYPNTSHPNEQGHLLIANHLYQWITNEI